MNSDIDVQIAEKKFKSVYYRKIDGRKFLGVQIVPGTTMLYDTVEKTISHVSKSSISKNFTREAKNRKLGDRFISKIKGHKVRAYNKISKPKE